MVLLRVLFCQYLCLILLSVTLSDRNSPCCKNCRFESADKICQEIITATCKGTSKCTGEPRTLQCQCSSGLHQLYLTFYPCVPLGKSSECPTPGNLDDNTECVDKGRCQKGRCVPFCEAVHNLESCACNGKGPNRPSSPCSLVPNQEIWLDKHAGHIIDIWLIT